MNWTSSDLDRTPLVLSQASGHRTCELPAHLVELCNLNTTPDQNFIRIPIDTSDQMMVRSAARWC